MLKRLLSVAVIVTLLFGSAAPAVFAKGEESPSIRLRLHHGEMIPKEGTVMFCRVAELEQSKEPGEIRFHLTKAYEHAGLNPNETPGRELAQNFLTYTLSQGIGGTEKQVTQGQVLYEIPKGQEGLYLCYQREPSEEGLVMTPILAAVPQKMDGSLSFAVTADPKMGLPEENPENPEDPYEPVPPEEDGEEPERVPGEEDELGGDGTGGDHAGGMDGDGLDHGGNGGKLPQTGGTEGMIFVLFALGVTLCSLGAGRKKSV